MLHYPAHFSCVCTQNLILNNLFFYTQGQNSHGLAYIDCWGKWEHFHRGVAAVAGIHLYIILYYLLIINIIATLQVILYNNTINIIYIFALWTRATYNCMPS